MGDPTIFGEGHTGHAAAERGRRAAEATEAALARVAPKPWGLLAKDAMALAFRRGPSDDLPPKTVTRRVGDRWAKCGVGRVLWVREVWCLLLTEPGEAPVEPPHVLYRASPDLWPAGLDARWCSSLVMPRWASRTTLRTLSVTRETWAPGDNLTDDEARREGFASAADFAALWNEMHPGFAGTVWRIEVERLADGVGA